MAGDWVKFEIDTFEKPEVIKMADDLGIPEEHVAGCLLKVWCWFDKQSRDGHVNSVTEKYIDRVTSVTGFAQAMQDVGWLILSDEGLTLPNFDKHNGNSAKSRALTTERKRKERSRKKRDTSVTREEKRREEKEKREKKENSEPDNSVSTCLPRTINPEAWSAWDNYRTTHPTKKIRESWTPTAQKSALKLLEPLTYDEQEAVIHHAIANGYQGFHTTNIPSGAGSSVGGGSKASRLHNHLKRRFDQSGRSRNKSERFHESLKRIHQQNCAAVQQDEPVYHDQEEITIK